MNQEALQDLGPLLHRRDEARVPAAQASRHGESGPILTNIAFVD